MHSGKKVDQTVELGHLALQRCNPPSLLMLPGAKELNPVPFVTSNLLKTTEVVPYLVGNVNPIHPLDKRRDVVEAST
ncbi:uncharacterized protein IUM83_02002 [Phytophthora cinnamomi]|uniref:uncharacterized protein n=1 Tax=Phytophthora cinnamomi TaxID=4785 RepID=UPI00355A1608|nr:hypothetical protein IUM83_02002 [Phytophthora cinnamomi]